MDCTSELNLPAPASVKLETYKTSSIQNTKNPVPAKPQLKVVDNAEWVEF